MTMRGLQVFDSRVFPYLEDLQPSATEWKVIQGSVGEG